MLDSQHFCQDPVYPVMAIADVTLSNNPTILLSATRKTKELPERDKVKCVQWECLASRNGPLRVRAAYNYVIPRDSPNGGRMASIATAVNVGMLNAKCYNYS